MTNRDFQSLSEGDAKRIADALAVSARGDGPTPTVALSDLPDADVRHLASLAALRNDVEREAVMAAIGEMAVSDRFETPRDRNPTSTAEAATSGLDYAGIIRKTVEEALEQPREPVDHESTAIYKTQLQKGGRIAVPEAEIRALDLDPGDTLQVELFKIADGE